jgi:hypothetical protein
MRPSLFWDIARHRLVFCYVCVNIHVKQLRGSKSTRRMYQTALPLKMKQSRIILSSVARLSLPYFSTLSLKRHGSREKVTGYEMCVLIFSTISDRNISHSKNGTVRY